MNGLDITRRVLERLRRPSETALPFKTILRTVGEVVSIKKLDLALSEQNSLAVTSDWFTPSSNDFEINEIGADNILLPVRMERRSIGSEYETGDEQPIVNFEVLNTSQVGAVSFYGSPLRIAFRDSIDYISEQEYRLIYETDFGDTTSLSGTIDLPSYFAAMIGAESAFQLVDLVEDESPEWQNFMKSVEPKWVAEITRWNDKWRDYVRKFKGKAEIPIRTFLQNRRCNVRTRYFRG